MTALTGEVLEQRDGLWRTVRLGNVRVNDRRRNADPLGLTEEQRRASDLDSEARRLFPGIPELWR